MTTIDSTELKESSLDLLDHAGPDGIVVLHDGKPVARLVAVPLAREKGAGHLIGILKGRVGIKGNVFSAEED